MGAQVDAGLLTIITGTANKSNLQGLAPASPHLEALRALNNAHAAELSYADTARFMHLIGQACFAQHIGQEAFLLAFDQSADYDSANFHWFHARFERFLYIDRVVTSPAARGQGHAAALYAALYAYAAQVGQGLIACEINEDPPNPGSEAFHIKQGFAAIGSAALSSGKRVRYFTRHLAKSA